MKNGSRVQGEGISKIKVSGFKSFSNEQSIEVRPLTILAGTNSSGKSSIMQPLLLMKQTLEASYDPGALLLNGPHVRFTSTEQVLCCNAIQSCDEFHVGFESSNTTCTLYYKKQKPGFQIKMMELSIDSKQATFALDMKEEEVRDIFKRFIGVENLDHWSIRRDRCFLRYEAVGQVSLGGRLMNVNQTIAPSIKNEIRNILHLPGLRGNPERTYPTSAIERDSILIGTFENYTASILAKWQDENNQEKLGTLEKHLKLLGLTCKVKTKQINDTEVEVFVARTLHSSDAEDWVSIADVGLGVSQTLPVAVALLFAQPGQLVYIEQPEIHLHPRAQYEMARLLAEAATRGVKVVMETHSSLLLRSIQTLVANGELSPDIVKLHWFTRSQQDGSTEINSADLDENGAFGEWPEDFGDVEMTADMRYLDAVEERGKSNE